MSTALGPRSLGTVCKPETEIAGGQDSTVEENLAPEDKVRRDAALRL